MPGYSTTATHQVYDKGDANIAYISLLSLADSWLNTGAFAKTPLTYRLYHGFYYSTSVHTVMTLSNRTDINSLHDLVGKKFFPFTTGSGSQLLATLVFGELGIGDKITERQMGTDQIVDGLKNGLVDAVWLYITGTLSATWADLDARVNLRAVTPNDQEKAVISKIPGIVAPVPVKTAGLFTKNVGVDTIWGTGLLFGMNFGPGEDEERVYQVVKAWYEHTDELVAVNQTFKEVAEKGVQMTVQAIDSLPNIPVHPGVAKYLKEKGVWKNTWKVGELYPRPKK
ncbi:MAG: TAXI family TRAP transporter solute-binding subunit [Dehalococcoidales bacterium]|nr:TAXI family TRAP transporter solute-binding subunit [Dehalococcoidales bacterium]